MRIGSHDKWKYATVVVAAALAVGFSFPQASAHVTSSTQHMLEHIYSHVRSISNNLEDVENKTDHLPSDPASQTNTGTTKAVLLEQIINPPDGDSISVLIADGAGDNSLSGHLSVVALGPADNTVQFQCIFGSKNLVPFSESSASFGDLQFTCQELYVVVNDDPDFNDEDGADVSVLAQFVETSNFSEVT
jgi:hypothetical protein